MGRQTGLVLIDRSQAFSPSVALLCVALRGLALRGGWLCVAWLCVALITIALIVTVRWLPGNALVTASEPWLVLLSYVGR